MSKLSESRGLVALHKRLLSDDVIRSGENKGKSPKNPLSEGMLTDSNVVSG